MTLGDGDFRKSLMKMIYRKLPKTASLPVTCHQSSVNSMWIAISDKNTDNDNRRLDLIDGDSI